MDDITLYETKPVVGPGQLQKYLNMVTEWADDNDMSLNATKTKQLTLHFTKHVKASQDLFIEGIYIDKQKVVKLLRVYMQNGTHIWITSSSRQVGNSE